MSESKPSVSGGFLFPGIVAAAAAISKMVSTSARAGFSRPSVSRGTRSTQTAPPDMNMESICSL